MFKKYSRGGLMVGAAFTLLLAAARVYSPPHRVPVSDASSRIPIATPPGITLQLREGPIRARVATAAQWVYADSRGKTLYTFEGEAAHGASCEGECAAVWPPALAPPSARPEGDWTLADRADGTRQWVHRGAPLHRFAGDEAIGDTKGEGAGGGAWHVAALRADLGLDLPDGISVREIADAGGMGLVDSSGMTLYAFEDSAARRAPDCGSGECAGVWLPLEAPAIANPTGQFLGVARDDGITQWTYRGRPLYKFAADQKPGDVNGSGADSRASVALI